MKKLMQAFQIKSIFLPSPSQNYLSSPSKSLISWITAYSTLSQKKAISPKLNVENSILADYLVGSLKLSKNRALSISSKLHCQTLEKPEQTVRFFRGLGFSDAHIRAIVNSVPRLLLSDTEKTLKPKVEFFQELGLSGPLLGTFISRTPCILYCSVDRCLNPRVDLIRKIIATDGRTRSKESVNDNLFRIITRCGRIILARHTLEDNVAYLKSCGVVGSQLSSLLVRLPRIFTLRYDKLEEVVSRALAMNFTMGSRMLVHGIHVLSCMNSDTFNAKYEVYKAFGFSKEEIDLMFRKSPYIFGLSVATLRRKLELLLSNLKLSRSVVVQIPIMLSMSIEARVMPRYKVLEILKLKGVLKKDPSLSRAMCMQESNFLDTYVLPFKTDVEELLLAYNDQLLNTSTKI
ncbi:transcription termination factor MTERF15, mitochondrial-like [Salvia miltiorrhiza]|uniref:transcription termination factor MTERF15, mitochondrial-like n=1 Tax=Salvia miltiorrhiza TaxID=226208 RepID=UPI0025AD49B7|nr:transcription termination factor MTERF15, mitochondrial-like [Salvia miltiorrhiza]